MSFRRSQDAYDIEVDGLDGLLAHLRKDWADLRDDQVDMVRRNDLFLYDAGKASWPSSSGGIRRASARTPRQREGPDLGSHRRGIGVMSRMFFKARPDSGRPSSSFPASPCSDGRSGQGFPWPYHRKLFRPAWRLGWDHEPASLKTVFADRRVCYRRNLDLIARKPNETRPHRTQPGPGRRLRRSCRPRCRHPSLRCIRLLAESFFRLAPASKLNLNIRIGYPPESQPAGASSFVPDYQDALPPVKKKSVN